MPLSKYINLFVETFPSKKSPSEFKCAPSPETSTPAPVPALLFAVDIVMKSPTSYSTNPPCKYPVAVNWFVGVPAKLLQVSLFVFPRLVIT